jgi:hypothetical protein
MNRLPKYLLLPAAIFSLAALAPLLGSIAPTTAPMPTCTVVYPGNLEDENGKAVKQPMLVEMHLLLTPALRADQLAPLEKQLADATNDVEKQKIQSRIDKLRQVPSLIAASQTLSLGGYERFALPLGDYEIHFIPINLPNRKPVILRMTHQSARTVANVQVAPEGAIIGGGPSVQELLKKIEDQQAQITALTQRIQKLEQQKP